MNIQKKQSLPWLLQCLAPVINWSVSGPFPQHPTKRLALTGCALVVRVAVMGGKVGGMGVSTPMKRSGTDSPIDKQTGR